MPLFQFQCRKEGTLFYYAHGLRQAARALVQRCPLCGSKQISMSDEEFPLPSTLAALPPGERVPELDESQPPQAKKKRRR